MRFSGIALALGATLVLSSCGEPKYPPIVGTVTYDKQVTLQFEPADRTRNAHLQGERCYYDGKNNYQEESFKFHKGDKVHVTIADHYNVRPGETYTYRLYFKEAGTGIVKPGAAYVLETSVPGTATKPVGVFEFDLAVDSNDPHFVIPEGTPLGGVYQLGQTDRSISVDMLFKLYTNIGYSTICGTYD